MSVEGVNSVRDRYHGELLEVQELCVREGLVFTEQMRWACRSIRTIVAMERGQEQQLDEDGRAWWPDDEELEERTPGVKLMMLARQIGPEYERKESYMDNTSNQQTGRATTIKSAPNLTGSKAVPTAPRVVAALQELGGAAGRGTIHTGRVPPIPGRASKGPSKTEIMGIGADQWIEVPKGSIKIVTLRQRVSQANSLCKKDGRDERFVCWENEDDGTMIVRRSE